MLVTGAVLQGRYRVERVLGEGGGGAVYLAVEETLGGKRVAIKEMNINIEGATARQAAIEQFQKEAHILATLDHPGIVAVTHYFEETGKQYLVMAYVDGQTLESVVNSLNTFLPVATALDWMDQLSDVLDYLHTHEPPVIFRDMKPTNVMLDSRNRIRLIDFGIARSFDSSKTADIIKGAGTAGFAPLEQFGAKGSSDPRTDIYALGATLYALLTRTLPPFSVDLATMDAVLIPPSKINRSISPELEAVILKMMALRKEDRYGNMVEVRSALKACASPLAPTPAPAPAAAPPLAPAPRPGGGLMARSGPPPAAAPAVRPLSAPLQPRAAVPPVVAEDPPIRRAEVPRPAAPGEPLQVVRGRFCPRCRAAIGPGSDTCHNCGSTSVDRNTQGLEASAAGGNRLEVATQKLQNPLAVPTGGLSRAVPPVKAAPKLSNDTASTLGKPRVQAVVQAPSSGGFLDFLKTSATMEGCSVVELKPDSITFDYNRHFKIPSSTSMKVSFEPLTDGKKAKPVVFDVKVNLASEQALSNTQWRYVGTFINLPAQIRTVLESVPTSERRSVKRYKEFFQVLSKGFPGYRALSVDISLEGMGVLLEAAVTVGTEVELLVDLGETSTGVDATGRVPILAEVIHCNKKPDGKYRIGLEFVEMSDGATRALKAYLARL